MTNSKGMAMLIVLGLVIMLLVLGGAVLMISTGHFGTTYHQISRTKAYYAAEAAMQHALWALRTGQADPLSGTVSLPTTFDVNGIEPSDITITVKSIENGVYPIDIDVTY